MEFKLRAITNNVDDSDTMTFHPDKSKNPPSETVEGEEEEYTDKCDATVPVLYTTLNGIHLRQFVRNSKSTSKYQSSFCDLERWVSQRRK